MTKQAKRIITERDGYNAYYDGYEAGALRCRVSCLPDQPLLALDLASLIADGYTRTQAGRYMANAGYDVRGIRVLFAARVV